MKRYVIIIMDEGWPNFYLTEDETIYRQFADAEDDETVMELLDEHSETLDRPEEGIVGVEVIDYAIGHTY